MDIEYLESVKKIFQELDEDVLLAEYFFESLGEPHQTIEAKFVTEKIFLQRGISLELTAENRLRLIDIFERKRKAKNQKDFPSIEVIGTTWFYNDWQESLKTSEKYGWSSENIKNIVEYYQYRSTPVTKADQEAMHKSEDEFWTAVHYGKHKPRNN